jgi:hypothetical protein
LAIAPTWSWINIHGEVQLHAIFDSSPVIDAIVVANLDAAKDGILEIEGSMICIQIEAKEAGSRNCPMITHDEDADALLSHSTDGMIHFDVLPEDMLPRDLNDPKALQIAIFRRLSDGSYVLEYPYSYGLIIGLSTVNSARWQRVGYYWLPLIPGRLEAFNKSRSKILLE